MYTFLANLAYVFVLCAFVTREILYLRALMIMAQAILVVYMLHQGVPVTAVWNALFLAINVVMIVQILRERRRVVLPDDLRTLHERHFAALSPQEFLRWWRQGRRERIGKGWLARAGQHPESLFFLLDGTVRVTRDDKLVADLPAGYFIAEMSLLTGEPANADVEAVAEIEVIRWSTHELRTLRQRNPTLWSKIQSVLGHDIVEKIRRGERHGSTASVAPPSPAPAPALQG